MTVVVSFDQVSKRYRRGRERANVRSAIPGRWGQERRGEYHWALKDVSFEVGAGESLGLVGPNGAGKSTALKLVAGVIAATSGNVLVRGRSASLIELGAGFHPDMTGRENVYFSASVLGMGPKALRTQFEEIIDFADIGQFLDTPVKRYSSGMMARLGFAVAAHLHAEIVVLDEVLAVGDAAFQRKCHERIAVLRNEGAALLYVTHALWTLPQLCDKAVLIVEGQVAARGSPAEVLRAYERHYSPASDADVGSGSGLIRSLRSSAPIIDPWGSLGLTLEIDVPRPCPYGQIVVSIADATGSMVGVAESHVGLGVFDRAGVAHLDCQLNPLPLQAGSYTIAVAFRADSRLPVHDDVRRLGLDVRGDEVNPTYGPVDLRCRWQVSPLSHLTVDGSIERNSGERKSGAVVPEPNEPRRVGP